MRACCLCREKSENGDRMSRYIVQRSSHRSISHCISFRPDSQSAPSEASAWHLHLLPAHLQTPVTYTQCFTAVVKRNDARKTYLQFPVFQAITNLLATINFSSRFQRSRSNIISYYLTYRTNCRDILQCETAPKSEQ